MHKFVWRVIFSVSVLCCSSSSQAKAWLGGEIVLPTTAARPASLARSQLAKSLGVPTNEVNIIGVEETTWPDDCLGTASAKPCGGGAIRGFRILLHALGSNFEYHADRKDRIRFGGPGDAPSLPKPVYLAKKELAAYLKLSLDRVEIVKVESALWPNTCLGLPAPELCAPGETPGYSITLRALGREFRYHSDREEVIRFAGPGDVPQRQR